MIPDSESHCLTVKSVATMLFSMVPLEAPISATTRWTVPPRRAAGIFEVGRYSTTGMLSMLCQHDMKCMSLRTHRLNMCNCMSIHMPTRFRGGNELPGHELP